MKKNLKEIDSKEVNEVVSLTKKILNLLYIVMIVAIVLCGTVILKKYGIFCSLSLKYYHLFLSALSLLGYLIP